MIHFSIACTLKSQFYHYINSHLNYESIYILWSISKWIWTLFSSDLICWNAKLWQFEISHEVVITCAHNKHCYVKYKSRLTFMLNVSVWLALNRVYYLQKTTSPIKIYHLSNFRGLNPLNVSKNHTKSVVVEWVAEKSSCLKLKTQ